MARYNIEDSASRLKTRSISFYKISGLIGEPESTIQNIFKGHSKYSDERTQTILEKINTYLDELDGKPSIKDFTAPNDSELFIKLYRLGLDSKGFTPEEKLKLALAHRELTQQKEKT